MAGTANWQRCSNPNQGWMGHSRAIGAGLGTGLEEHSEYVATRRMSHAGRSTHAFMHSCIHALMHSCTPAFMHSLTHALMDSCTHKHSSKTTVALPQRRGANAGNSSYTPFVAAG
jgi:hypothetical protein